MIDVGETLENKLAVRRDRMASVEPKFWAQTDIEATTRIRRENYGDGMRPFGSDFPVRDTVGFFAEGAPDALALRPSFALGGLSNGWGAAVLPYRTTDLTGWPDITGSLAEHYRAVSEFVPIAARQDDLEQVFSLWSSEGAMEYPAGPQGTEFLNRLHRRRVALAARGVTIGRARIAFQANACRACGLCLYGCPYGLIFNAAAEVQKFKNHEGFSYEGGLRAIRFEDREQQVHLHVADAKSGEQRIIEGARLFIGAGVLPTARIVLNSIPNRIQKLTLLDSQQALMPMLHSWSPPNNLETAPSNALAQAFVEIEDKAISQSTIHGQVYAYNDLYRSDLRLRFGLLANIFDPLIGALARRLLVIQLFAHSDHCGKIGVSLSGMPGDACLTYSSKESAETRLILSRAARKLARLLLPAGVLALPSQMRLGEIGSSFHVGGSLPMSNQPSDGQTDIYGRIAGTNHTHVIDASVFPSIPATTITFTVMANAHRIATNAPL
ncbi:MAG: GMC oxidoreductase [Parvularculaceae bacterium]